MIPSLRYIALVSVVFLALQKVATGVSCYSCLSCSSSSSYGETSSTASGAACYKYVYSVLGIVSYINRGVITGCSSGSDGLGGTYYCCSTDYCNGSVSLSSSLGLAFALVVALIIFKRMMNN